ncbi:MAG: U32 family peptidase [Verrucomicrobia bacterium]|nr:U32 family peptidase [Verrucomicrobiota bacterium]
MGDARHHPVPNREPSRPAPAARAGATPARGACLPELVAPAGDWDCARAAVENGADAVYFGLEKHNARMRARNFTMSDLPKLLGYLHGRGVKGYVTFNTLVFPGELAEAEQWLRGVIAVGADAAMVQDIGICRLIRRLSPDFPIHASTQMTVTSAAGVAFARALGCDRVVLARECSIRDIERIQAALAASGGPDPVSGAAPGLEIFVHGALCVAYSGQCLTSESLGGRSANRGVCAQACRMPYVLVADGRPVPLGDRRYLLSPRDLAGLQLLPPLARAGVASLKIEGRLKSPEYVATITRIYRAALDTLAADPAAATADRLPVSAQTRYEMEMAFSRGLHTGWMEGVNHRELVHGRFGKKRGVFLGRVSRIRGEAVAVRLAGPLKPGDGVVFDAGHPEHPEEGGRVYEVRRRAPRRPQRAEEPADECWLAFGRGDIDFRRVHVGDSLWKTSDPELDRRLHQSYRDGPPRFQRPLTLHVRGHAGELLTLTARDELGHTVTLVSTMPLAAASTRPLTTPRLRDQLGRLGGTPFRLGTLHNDLPPDVMLPVSELNRLRRDAVTRLEHQRRQPPRWTLHPAAAAATPAEPACSQPPRDRTEPASPLEPPELAVLVRTPPQLEAALQCGASRIYADFEDLRKYREAVRAVRSAPRRGGPGAEPGPRPAIWVAPPRIFKPGEEWMLEQVRSCGADGYLVRNYDHLSFFAGCRCVGDFPFNVANRLSAEHLVRGHGLERVTVSYDLNISELDALLRSAPPAWFEVTLHQHMPMFHMDHCVFCAFLSRGDGPANCGRPCDHHEVRLRDRAGADHFVRADAGCRNTVFNARAQTGAESVARLLARGARQFRIEFMQETPDQAARTIDSYRALLQGERSGAHLRRDLKLISQLGVTRSPENRRRGRAA